MEKDVAIAELRRVAEFLSARSISRGTFDKYGTIASATIEATFGSWNEGIVAAGLIPFPQGGLPKTESRRMERLGRIAGRSIEDVSDNELLDELRRVATLLGRRPSGNQLAAKGKYGRDIYQRRWGSVASAYDEAKKRDSGPLPE